MLSVELCESELSTEPVTDSAGIHGRDVADLQSIRDTVDTHPIIVEHRNVTVGIGEP
jgi:hypothetical protein